MRTWFAIAWRNLSRQGRRSLITASAMAVSVALCMCSICVNEGTYGQMFEVMVEQQLGHVLVSHPDYLAERSMYDTIPDAAAAVARVEATPGVAASTPRLKGYGLLGGPERSAGVQLVGIDPEREARVTPLEERVKQGTWLVPGEHGTVLLGDKLAAELGVGVGDEVVAVTQAADGSLGNALYRVTGVFRSGDAQMDRSGAYLHLADLQELLALPDQVHGITILASNPEVLGPTVEALRAGAPDQQVLPWQEVSPQTAQLLSMQDAAAVMILGIVFLVASFGVVNTMLVSVFERTREFGVMRALGVGPAQLVTMVILEAVLLACLAAVLGLVLGGSGVAYLTLHGIDFSASIPDGFDMNGVVIDPVLRGRFRLQPVVMNVTTLIVVSALAAVWPATRAAWIKPIDAIRAD